MSTRRVGSCRSVRCLIVATLIAGVTVFPTPPVSADALIQNEMAATMAPGGSGIEAYAYGTGIDHLFNTAALFDTGVITGLGSVVGDAVEIDGVPLDQWWDLLWQRRQCFDVSAQRPLAQYPIRVVADTTGLTTDDIRVVPVTTPASMATPLPHYVEPDVGTDQTSVWFQAPVGAAQTYCVYFDSGQPSTSTEFGPFTSTNGQSVAYYTMTNAYTGNGMQGRVQVVSYVDGNVVSDGTNTVTLNVGDLHVFDGLDHHAVITATGPIDASYNRSNREALLPEGFADDRFLFPTSRRTQQFWVRSPHGSTTIEAVIDGVVVASVSVAPGDGSVAINADATGTDFVILRSVDGVDFLASHKSTNNMDTFHGVPWFGDDLIGVASNRLQIGSILPGTITYDSSAGTGSAAVSPAAVTTIGGNGPRGAGRAYRLTGADHFHAIQQADDNGNESTSFLPSRLLSQTFRIPARHRYVAVACPVPSTAVIIGGTSFNCDTGATIGHTRRGIGSYGEGTLVEADHPVFVYYETFSGSDEHNIYGAKGAIPYVGDVAAVPGPVETQSITACVSWLSPAFATADVFGLTNIDVDGTFTFQISFDGGSFVGPDGTGATSFGDGSVVPFQADGASTAQILVDFCGSSGDRLRSVSFECSLVEVIDGAPVVAVAGDGVALRVYPGIAGSDAWIELVATSGADSYVVSTDVNGAHITAVAGVVSNPAPAFTTEPYSVDFSGVTPQASQLSVILVEQGAVRFEVPIEFDIVN